ncbi:MAG: UvrD-helicase domain-containing protein, partial [bacterium]
MIFFDEHQDARSTQHQMVEALLASGQERIRILGDPMQAIYAFDADDPMVDWSVVRGLANHCDELDEPHRWQHAPALGEWIHNSRLALAAGDPLPEPAPPEVTIRRIAGLPDCQAGSQRPAPALSGSLQRIIDNAQGSLAVLTRTNRNALGLRRTVSGCLHIMEDAALLSAFDALARAISHIGSASELAQAV